MNAKTSLIKFLDGFPALSDHILSVHASQLCMITYENTQLIGITGPTESHKRVLAEPTPVFP